MMKHIWLFLLGAAFVAVLFSCAPGGAGQNTGSTEAGPALMPADESAPIMVSDAAASTAPAARWAEATHRTLSSIAATQWGLSAGRAANISEASDDPDTYQAGIDHAYAQQWYHAYIFDDWFGSTFYLWGGADVDFHDNLIGPSGGGGYNGLYAGYYYSAANQYQGDRYVGYALHYIEDVSITLHSTAPDSAGVTVPYYTLDMITHHNDYEQWVANNTDAGYRLLDAVAADYYYYPVTDPVQSLKNAAWASCAYRGTSSPGYSAWKEYRNCGYPTATGSGTTALANATKQMLIAAGRYAKGAVKYTMDMYGQWGSTY